MKSKQSRAQRKIYEKSIIFRNADSIMDREEQIGNISVSGAYVRTGTALAEGTRCSIEIDGQEQENDVILVSGKVVRHDQSGIGIAFQQVDEETKEQLNRLIDSAKKDSSAGQ